jgi:hypothetical protein
MNDVPSDSFVRDPLSEDANKDPLTTTSPPNTARPDPPSPPDTKNVVSDPGRDGNEEFGRFAKMTVPETPINEPLETEPEILLVIRAMPVSPLGV